MSEKFLSVRDLRVEYRLKDETVRAVNGVSFDLEKGQTLGLVGETGAGKTTIARAILGILQSPPGVVTGGQVILDGTDLLKLSEEEMYSIRGNRVTIIFQDPMTALNPVISVGEQIAEVIRLHEHLSARDARVRAEEMLETVGIPAERYIEYPHQFSGGMKQRVVIAIALACSPDLLLADEPTTALDVSIQAQILNLLQDLQQEKGLAYMFITHDLSVVRHISNDISVMYLGQLVETGPAKELFVTQLHPYTKALLSAVPSTNIFKKRERIILKGEIVSPINPDPGCRFAARCPCADSQCSQPQKLEELTAGHFVSCCKARAINGLV